MRPSPFTVVVGLAAASAVVRFAVAARMRTPLYYPDEYIHTAFARSIADGTFPHVRGGSVAFFSYLAPLLMSPAWLIGDVHLAYRVAQAFGCIAFATAAFPAYLLARRVGLSGQGALAVVLLALVLPDGVFTANLLAEPYAYPLILLGVLAGVDAIARPTIPRQLSVVALSLALPLLGGAQFFVFGLAYLPASYLGGPRSLGGYIRSQRIVLLAIALGAAAVVADAAVSGSGRIASVYDTATISFRYPIVGSITWFGVNLFVLAIAAGWVIVPGALIGFHAMLASHDPGRRAFALFGSLLIVGQLLEATPFGVNANSVLERYAFYGAPLFAVAFVYALDSQLLKHRSHVLLAAAGAAAAAGLLLPVTSPLLGRTIDESPSLLGLSRFDLGGLAAPTVWGPALAALALAAMWRSADYSLIFVAVATSLAISVAVSWTLVQTSNHLEVSRVDASEGSAIVTWSGEDPTDLMQALFWNRGVRRVLVLDSAFAPDGFPSVPVRLASGPRILSELGQRISGPFVFGPDVLIAGGVHDGVRPRLVTLQRPPSVFAFGWNSRTGQVSPAGWIYAVANRTAIRLSLRLRAVDGSPKTLRLRCKNGGEREEHIGQKPTLVSLSIPSGQAQACRFSFVRGSFRFLLGQPASVIGGMTVHVKSG